MNDFSRVFESEFLDGLAPGETVVDADVPEVPELSEENLFFDSDDVDDEVTHFADDESPPESESAPDGASDFASAFGHAMQGEVPNLDDVLGEIATVPETVSEREAASNPVVRKQAISLKERKWQIDSGQVFGPAGGETDITLRPQCLFRCEKIMATDDSSNPGAGTRILSVTIGQKVQKLTPGGNGTLTQFFSAQALANGIRFDTNQPYQTITIRIRFTVQCNFELSLWGTAVVDE